MRGQSILLAAGSNSGGQLGLRHEEDAHALRPSLCSDGTSFPPKGFSAVELSSGSNHTVAIIASETGNRQLWASGSGQDGQLGRRWTGMTTSYQQLDLQEDLDLASLLPSGRGDVGKWQPAKVACGWTSTFVAFEDTSSGTQEDDVLVVLGKSNDFGQLGLGEGKVMQASVARVVLPPGAAKMKITDIACGLRHTIVQCSSASSKDVGSYQVRLFGWGAARLGQLGVKKTIQWEPYLLDEWTSSGDSPTFIGAGKEHTVYFDAGRFPHDEGVKNAVHYLGSNRQGQLDICNADLSAGLKTAGCTWNATMVVLQDDTLLGSGNNSKGQLGIDELGEEGIAKWHLGERLSTISGKGDRKLHSAVCGSEHVLALVGEGDEKEDRAAQVWGWGWNEHGNLAQDDELDRTTPVRIFPPRFGEQSSHSSSRPTRIWAGCGTSFIQVYQPADDS